MAWPLKLKQLASFWAAIQKPIVVASWRSSFIGEARERRNNGYSYSKLNKWIIKRSAVMRHLLDTTEFNKEETKPLIAQVGDMKAASRLSDGLAGKNIVTV